MNAFPERERLNVVIAGHVDHGKSTVAGRLLADTGSLPRGKLDELKARCARDARALEYAYLLDAFRDEQSRGITIDAARVFLKTELRDYLLIDTPGHVEFMTNMVSGASCASAALLVIDAAEGMRENSKRHGRLLSMLGVRQIVVLVNKMDRVDYDRQVFDTVAEEYRIFLSGLGMTPAHFIPTAAALGENIVRRSTMMTWYNGPTAIETMDGFQLETAPIDRPFRLPVQDVYRFTADGDDRRIVVGTVEAGSLKAGDQLVFYPSGKTSAVKSLETFPRDDRFAFTAGDAAGFTLSEQIHVRRGEIATRRGEPRPAVAKRLKTSIFWLGREPLRSGRDYTLKLCSARARVRLREIAWTLDGANLEPRDGPTDVRRHEAAECILELDTPLAFERAREYPALGRFVLMEDDEIRGAGLVLEPLEDDASPAREKTILRNMNWRTGLVDMARREKRLNQASGVVLVTGSEDALRREAAKALELRLFDAGRFVYFLGIGSVLYGVDADIRGHADSRAEDVRRLGEVSYILADAGLILVATAAALTDQECDLLRESVGAAKILVVWIGSKPKGGVRCDLDLPAASPESVADRILAFMRERSFPPADAN